MSIDQTDELRFYLDDVDRMIGSHSGWSLTVYDHPAFRIAYGVIGVLLLVLSAATFIDDGLETEVFVYTNALLGLAFLAVAFKTRAGAYLFGQRFDRPYLALHDDRIAVSTDGTERSFAWDEVAVVEQRTTALVVVPQTGAPISIAFSDLSYQRVQDIRREVLSAAEQHGVTVR